MLECSWKVSNPFKFSITFHLISFEMPRKQKTFVAVVLGTFPQKTAPQCAGSSVASVSTRCFPMLECSDVHTSLHSWVMEKIRNKKMEPVCDCKKDCVRYDQKKKQSLKT